LGEKISQKKYSEMKMWRRVEKSGEEKSGEEWSEPNVQQM
jgi:hypothetical protein